MTKKIVTRFAPSPTGYLHIGGARTALYNYLLAKNTGGKFLLRIEDTDYDRNNADAAQAILEGMAWLGMTPDAEPVFQSSRIAHHKAHAAELITTGKAYYCTCTKEELDAKRAIAGEGWHYDRTCFDKNRVAGAIRLKVPQNKIIKWEDMVKGEIAFNSQEMDDFIIARGDGTPVYNLAVVCDDHDMGVNTIIRGDDHVSNTPKQILLYEALGWEIPEFGHVPMIYGEDKKKLSKRHGAMSVIDYKGLGYLPDAVINFLARLGWSSGDTEIFSKDELIKAFNTDKLNKSPAIFDFKKLGWVNQEHIKRMSVPEQIEIMAANVRTEHGVHIPALHGVLLKRCQTFKDMNEMLDKVITPKPELCVSMPKDKIIELGSKVSRIPWGTVLDAPESELSARIKVASAEHNCNIKEVFSILNLAVYGDTSAPDTAALCGFLGKEEVARRINLLTKDGTI